MENVGSEPWVPVNSPWDQVINPSMPKDMNGWFYLPWFSMRSVHDFDIWRFPPSVSCPKPWVSILKWSNFWMMWGPPIGKPPYHIDDLPARISPAISPSRWAAQSERRRIYGLSPVSDRMTYDDLTVIGIIPKWPQDNSFKLAKWWWNGWISESNGLSIKHVVIYGWYDCWCWLFIGKAVTSLPGSVGRLWTVWSDPLWNSGGKSTKPTSINEGQRALNAVQMGWSVQDLSKF